MVLRSGSPAPRRGSPTRCAAGLVPVPPGPRLLPYVGPGARTHEATAAAGRSPLVVTREPVTASGAVPPLVPAGSHGWQPTGRPVPTSTRPGSPGAAGQP